MESFIKSRRRNSSTQIHVEMQFAESELTNESPDLTCGHMTCAINHVTRSCNRCMSSVYCVTGLVNYLWPCDLSWGSMWHHMINPSLVCHMISLCNHVTCHWCIMWPETVSHDPTWGQTWCSWRDCDHIWPKSALRHQCLQLQGRRWSSECETDKGGTLHSSNLKLYATWICILSK